MAKQACQFALLRSIYERLIRFEGVVLETTITGREYEMIFANERVMHAKIVTIPTMYLLGKFSQEKQ